MKILVMGTGAVGGYFGARLQASGEDVTFCARGNNLAALTHDGLELKSISGDLRLEVTAAADPRELGPYDLVLFCVKAYDTDEAAGQIEECLAPGGAILTLQNGVENEARLVAKFGPEAVMGSNARVGAELISPGTILHLSSGYIDFGELDGRISDRVRTVAEAFRGAGVLGKIFDRPILSLRWDKLVWNAAFNTVATLTRRRVGDLLDDPPARQLLMTLMSETLRVANAEGAGLSARRIEEYFDRSERLLRDLKTSTQQDFDRGKQIEYEALSGAVLRAARRHRIPVPATEVIYALLRMLGSRRPRG